VKEELLPEEMGAIGAPDVKEEAVPPEEMGAGGRTGRVWVINEPFL